jgi:hypothetical protein
MYHTQIQNIQILVKMKFFRFPGMDQQLCYNNFMTENIDETSYDGPMCCAACTCTAGHSSKPPANTI